MRPFRFGVVGERVRSGDGLIETARAAEAAGYATFLLRDHLVAEPFGAQLAPLTALATAAAATTTLRVGTMVLANDFRHPAVLAKEAATLDLLSGGRFERGIGAGWLREEYARASISFDPAGVRIERLEESLNVLKGLLEGGPFSFAGRHYAIDDLQNFPAPTQQPRPPILVGGGGKRMLGLAAREADVVGVMGSSVASGVLVSDPAELGPARIAEKVGWVREAAGDRFAAIELSMVASVAVAPGGDRRAAAERFAAEHGWSGVGADEVLAMPTVLVGSVDAIVDDLQARRESQGFSYVVVGDGDLAAFAPVVARLAGR